MKAVVRFERVQKDLKRIPFYIRDKAFKWALDVETFGISSIRMTPGYHDEPLKGGRAGQRSVRLSKGYRLIYVEIESHILIIEILEINKHEY